MVCRRNLLYSESEKTLGKNFIDSDSEVFDLPPGIIKIGDISHNLPSIRTVTNDDIRLRTSLIIELTSPVLNFNENSLFHTNLEPINDESNSGTFNNEIQLLPVELTKFI